MKLVIRSLVKFCLVLPVLLILTPLVFARPVFIFLGKLTVWPFFWAFDQETPPLEFLSKQSLIGESQSDYEIVTDLLKMWKWVFKI